MNQLSLINIACERGETRLFEGCSLTVSSGQWWQVEGHNGIGKTSLLRILAGLAVAAEGDVLWNGVKIQQQRDQYYENLFYLGHHAGVKPELTAWENLRFYQKIQGLPLEDEALWNALAKVSLIGREDLPCSHLSAGQSLLPAPPVVNQSAVTLIALMSRLNNHHEINAQKRAEQKALLPPTLYRRQF